MALEVVTGSLQEYITALKQYGSPQDMPPIYIHYTDDKEINCVLRTPFGAIVYVETLPNATEEDVRNRATEIQLTLQKEGFTAVRGYIIP